MRKVRRDCGRILSGAEIDALYPGRVYRVNAHKSVPVAVAPRYAVRLGGEKVWFDGARSANEWTRYNATLIHWTANHERT